MSENGEFSTFFDDACRKRLLCGVFGSYYGEKASNHVIFDTNRTWTGKAALISDLFPESRIICCVRDIGWIIDSIERMLTKNPLHLSRILGFKPGHSVYSRAETLMNSENGLIGQAWSTLRESWFGEFASKLIFVQYDSLVRSPRQVIEQLYTHLNEPFFTHDFANVIYENPDYDTLLGMPGMHKVRQKVEHRDRQLCIPPDLFAKYIHTNFWTKPELNHRNVKLL